MLPCTRANFAKGSFNACAATLTCPSLGAATFRGFKWGGGLASFSGTKLIGEVWLPSDTREISMDEPRRLLALWRASRTDVVRKQSAAIVLQLVSIERVFTVTVDAHHHLRWFILSGALHHGWPVKPVTTVHRTFAGPPLGCAAHSGRPLVVTGWLCHNVFGRNGNVINGG